MLDVSLGFVQLKERLLRGLVHTGLNAALQYHSQTFGPRSIFDWSIAVAPGWLRWHGSTDLSFDVAPMDVGYAMWYHSPMPTVRMYVGGYARLQTNYTQYIQLDGQHPYWCTLDQLGIRHWFDWRSAGGSELMVESDLSLVALASRPPEWRDYSTTALNAWGIVQRVYSSPRIVTLFDGLRFMTRAQYQPSSESSRSLVYYYQFEYNMVDIPSTYTNIQSRLGVGIPLSQ